MDWDVVQLAFFDARKRAGTTNKQSEAIVATNPKNKAAVEVLASLTRQIKHDEIKAVQDRFGKDRKRIHIDISTMRQTLGMGKKLSVGTNTASMAAIERRAAKDTCAQFEYEESAKQFAEFGCTAEKVRKAHKSMRGRDKKRKEAESIEEDGDGKAAAAKKPRK